MNLSNFRSRSVYALAVILTIAAIARAEDLHDWYCPYTPDGTCAPKRQTYGYFAPKWRRWPGVTNADYESKRPPQEPFTPPPSADSKGLPPTELLLPPTQFRRDEAPTPPGGDGEPQPLTPDARPTPDILSPPGEDVMDELLPGVEQPTQPGRGPSIPNRTSPQPSAPSDGGVVPFPEAESPANTRPAPRSGAPAGPAPSLPNATQPETHEPEPATPPGESDPFKDDPFFNDAAPAPSGSRQPSRLDRQLEFPSETMPARHDTPARLPEASLGRQPQSRLSRTGSGGQPTPARPNRGFSQAGPRVNPLRPAVPPEEGRVLPAAAWQAEADLATPEPSHQNALR